MSFYLCESSDLLCETCSTKQIQMKISVYSSSKLNAITKGGHSYASPAVPLVTASNPSVDIIKSGDSSTNILRDLLNDPGCCLLSCITMATLNGHIGRLVIDIFVLKLQTEKIQRLRRQNTISEDSALWWHAPVKVEPLHQRKAIPQRKPAEAVGPNKLGPKLSTLLPVSRDLDIDTTLRFSAKC